jgi:hypothetical protein
MKVLSFSLGGLAAMALSASAFGGFTVQQTFDPVAIYTEKTITFDEPGVPTGAADPLLFYQSSNGAVVSSLNTGSGAVGDWNTLYNMNAGLGNLGNSYIGGFGVRIDFNKPVDELSFQGWADGGLFQGGMSVFLLDASDNVIHNAFFSGSVAYGSNAGSEKEWYNVVATAGDYFDAVVFYNPSFSSFSTFTDNISWNNVPAPGAMALLGLAGVAARRRRRS